MIATSARPAGKTTLVNLLMRFYDVDSGIIRVNGVDIREVKKRFVAPDLRRVLQDVALLRHDSRNIAYGRERATGRQS
jgi:ABC-type multidrug transport system fused ATPase/permease subunit